MTFTDEQLLKQAQQLNPDALRSLHHRFYEPVARYISFKVGDPQVVEDLSSEVFLRVIEGLKRGYGWQGSPQGWIMGIARNVVADHYRKREKMTEVVLSDQLPSSEKTDPRHHALQKEQMELLRSAIAQLTDEQRDVVIMRFIQGVNINGVAEALKKTPGAVKGLQFRALKALAEIMNEMSPEGSVGAEHVQ
ncbi:MAG: sigma-70 family RNA polymerase sigma factor [Anaerolineae bacterium]